ncbi:MAG: rRNA maturation RNase YbeY [Pseudomonadota bacterium]
MSLILQNEQALSAPAEATFNQWAEIALQDHNPNDIVIRITDAAESRELNQRYRGKDRPTNVLSFPCTAPPGLPQDYLGDLVICAPLVIAEATAQHKPPDAHWAHLVIHGILHLRGYDHQTEAEAQIMETLEQQLLQQLGYPDPYTTHTEENTTT